MLNFFNSNVNANEWYYEIAQQFLLFFLNEILSYWPACEAT